MKFYLILSTSIALLCGVVSIVERLTGLPLSEPGQPWHEPKVEPDEDWTPPPYTREGGAREDETPEFYELYPMPADH